jgi:hypothetical protein
VDVRSHTEGLGYVDLIDHLLRVTIEIRDCASHPSNAMKTASSETVALQL